MNRILSLSSLRLVTITKDPSLLSCRPTNKSRSHAGRPTAIQRDDCTMGSGLGFCEFLTVSSVEKGSDKSSTNNGGLNLKATELRLGLPSSESPERGDRTANISLYKISLSISGAKRGFSDAVIGASGKWGFSGSGGSEPAHDLGKNGGGLFSQRDVLVRVHPKHMCNIRRGPIQGLDWLSNNIANKT